ncbi:sigma-70 family RNA polymerase sigma factor [Streptomyces sp. NPDC102467]|uniref:sigma-70 family RNA polymerase sigma factor n=1 Tax=Streptomyces sp. NPDC102467 TaxID=3366179 RepID=UPI003813699D
MNDRHDRAPQPIGPSDDELMLRVRAGEQTAFEELFRRHAGAVCRYAHSMGWDAHAADDLTAEVFTRTLQAVRRGAGPHTAVLGYLLTSVRHLAATWATSAARTQSVDDFAALPAHTVNAGAAQELIGPGADTQAMHIEEQSLALRAFRSLPERWQLVLWHIDIQQRMPRDVAPLLSLTPNAVSALHQRAREGLKQAYLQQHISAVPPSRACQSCAEQLGAYARRALGKRAERSIRKHLKACPPCQDIALEIESLSTAIRVHAPAFALPFSPADIDYLNSFFGTSRGSL